MANESDSKLDTMHGDTHAQSFTVFALTYLLGIKLMPRIRNIKDLFFTGRKPVGTTRISTPCFEREVLLLDFLTRIIWGVLTRSQCK